MADLLALTLDASAKQIKLFGTDKAINVAKMLIDLHAKHQGDIQRRLQEREDLAAKLQAEREKRQSGCRLEFPIVKEVIGLIVGKNGSGKTVRDADTPHRRDARGHPSAPAPRAPHLLAFFLGALRPL